MQDSDSVIDFSLWPKEAKIAASIKSTLEMPQDLPQDGRVKLEWLYWDVTLQTFGPDCNIPSQHMEFDCRISVEEIVKIINDETGGRCSNIQELTTEIPRLQAEHDQHRLEMAQSGIRTMVNRLNAGVLDNIGRKKHA